MTKKSDWLFLAVAIILGLIIAWIDTRPSWDDAGITAAMIIIAAGVVGFLAGKRPWIWALAVGIWIPLWNIVTTNSFGSLIVIIISFIGAYAGTALRKMAVGRDADITN